MQRIIRGLAAARQLRVLAAFFMNRGATNAVTAGEQVAITELTIRNFRNIASLDVELPEAGVVIIGENGQGKTNFLEAIYYLVLFRSFRGAKDRDLVRFGTDGFFVAASNASRVTAGYEIAGKRKKVTIDGVVVEKLGAAVGRVAAVGFSSSDRTLITGGPADRRRYLDVLLSLCNATYLRHLTHMRAALKQRNAALRSGEPRAAQAFDDSFARAACAVAAQRSGWVARWQNRYREVCASLGEQLTPSMQCDSHRWDAREGHEALTRMLGAVLDRDLRRGQTTVGPHRDDLILQLGNRSLRMYGSAGQQRTAAIALRLLEAESLAQEGKHRPIALYDDVFVELDQTRQARLLELIERALPGQAIITAPRDSEVPRPMRDRPRWNMQGGQLVQA